MKFVKCKKCGEDIPNFYLIQLCDECVGNVDESLDESVARFEKLVKDFGNPHAM